LLSQFEPAFAAFIQTEMQTDLAHDYQHVLRVFVSKKVQSKLSYYLQHGYTIVYLYLKIIRKELKHHNLQQTKPLAF